MAKKQRQCPQISAAKSWKLELAKTGRLRRNQTKVQQLHRPVVCLGRPAFIQDDAVNGILFFPIDKIHAYPVVAGIISLRKEFPFEFNKGKAPAGQGSPSIKTIEAGRIDTLNPNDVVLEGKKFEFVMSEQKVVPLFSLRFDIAVHGKIPQRPEAEIILSSPEKKENDKKESPFTDPPYRSPSPDQGCPFPARNQKEKNQGNGNNKIKPPSNDGNQRGNSQEIDEASKKRNLGNARKAPKCDHFFFLFTSKRCFRKKRNHQGEAEGRKFDESRQTKKEVQAEG